MTQKERFIEWLQLQPRQDDPKKKYSPYTAKAAAAKLETGFATIPGFETTNCFAITAPADFQPVYDGCYAAATAADQAQGHRDFRNGLDYYLQFLQYPEKVRENIRRMIAHYKAAFSDITPKERYKWVAVKHYKDHWDIEAPNFAEMVEQAFAKAGNLLTSANVHSYKMLVQFAQKEPEAARTCFRALYDESTPVEQRVQAFLDFFQKKEIAYKENTPDLEKSFTYSQDRHAVTVYLSFEYPETYYIYKSTACNNFASHIGFSRNTAHAKLLSSFNELCDYVLTEVSLDADLLDMHRARLDSTCYQDPALHLLTTDVIFYGGAYMDEVSHHTSEVYDPHLTKEQWKEYILNVELPDHPKPMQMLKAMMNEGGAASCRQLAETYGGTYNRYIGCVVNLGKRVKAHFNLATYIKNGTECFYAIPFFGEYSSEENNDAFIYQIRPELMAALEEIDLSGVDLYAEEKNMTKKTDIARNTILFGPPGTGKTYQTADYAVSIIQNIPLAQVQLMDRQTIMELYNTYKAQGLIEFTTFHQSYGYEEFIEGIKPSTDEKGQIQYQVEPGTFKKFCQRAIADTTDFDADDFDATDPDTTTFEFADFAAANFGAAWDKLVQAAKANGSQYTFIRRTGKPFTTQLREDGVFFIQRPNSQSIFKKDTVRDQWQNHEYADRATIQGNGNRWSFEARQAIIDALTQQFNLSKEKQFLPKEENHVFIIDEINRGNISKIFGELITLIEDSKRLGCKDATHALLPYSQTPFGIPENVYILGTMNTADRSIATIDTALRRRFAFREMLPDPSVLKGVFVEDISIEALLETLNKRVAALYDREHTIGHAYFTDLKENSSKEVLAKIFRDKVIPLLQEYFYEDYEKIRLVLGDNRKAPEYQFIRKNECNAFDLFGVQDLELQDSYTVNEAAFLQPDAYKI